MPEKLLWLQVSEMLVQMSRIATQLKKCEMLISLMSRRLMWKTQSPQLE